MDIRQTWKKLKDDIICLLNERTSNTTFEDSYHNVYTLVQEGRGNFLYNSIKGLIKSYLIKVVRPAIIKSENDNFLSQFVDSWNDFSVSIELIDNMTMYLQRIHVKRQYPRIPGFKDFAPRLFRDEIILDPSVSKNLKLSLFNVVVIRRQNQQLAWNLFKQACQILITLGFGNRNFYESQFENWFLQKSAEFYRNFSKNLLAENNAFKSMMKIIESLSEDKKFIGQFLDPLTEIKLIECFIHECISTHAQTIVDMSNVNYILENNLFGDFNFLYNFLKRVPNGTDIIDSAVIKYLHDRNAASISKIDELLHSTDSAKYVQSICNFKEEMDRFVFTLLKENCTLKTKIQNEISNLVNPNLEHFLTYINNQLKKESKDNSFLEIAVTLFKLLKEKDIFEKYYRRDLAKRLLQNKNSSYDTEKYMILGLKEECGNSFTRLSEEMIKDSENSQTLMADYNKFQHLNNINFSIKVLTKNYWPITDIPSCVLPLPAESAFNNFKDFYLSKHSSRTLTINPFFGSAEMKATFYKKQNNGSIQEEKKTLIVSTFQMCILMLFNESDSLSYKQLLNETKIPDRDLKRALAPMVFGKENQRILTPIGNHGNKIEASDIFSINEKFSSPQIRIRIQRFLVTNEKNELKQNEIQHTIKEDRKYEIEAAIIRVMKSQKSLVHNVLIAEVTKQLQPRFMTDPAII